MASKYYRVYQGFQKLFNPSAKKKTDIPTTIIGVKPSINKSKIQKTIDDVRLTALKARGQMKKKNQDFDRDIQKVKASLGQSMQKLKGEPVTKSGVSKGKDMKQDKARVKKMGGGMMGRRMNYKKGSKKFPDLTGDGKVTFADILKGRGVINGKKKGKA